MRCMWCRLVPRWCSLIMPTNSEVPTNSWCSPLAPAPLVVTEDCLTTNCVRSIFTNLEFVQISSPTSSIACLATDQTTSHSVANQIFWFIKVRGTLGLFNTDFTMQLQQQFRRHVAKFDGSWFCLRLLACQKNHENCRSSEDPNLALASSWRQYHPCISFYPTVLLFSNPGINKHTFATISFWRNFINTDDHPARLRH